ncbi:hypothetical protein HRbin15_01268 [bacterium HR15]|nr:hypothetical protein HRbin15_01268 [bacterium HR15]
MRPMSLLCSDAPKDTAVRMSSGKRQRAEQERLLREQMAQRVAELEAELRRLRGET